MKNNVTVYLLATFILSVFLASCDSQSDTAPGSLRVSLTDAPAEYDAVYIDIREVLVHSDASADDDESEWTVINDHPVRVNLLDLTNGRQEILGEEELQPGQLRQVRLVLGDDNELVIDGASHELTTPSAQQSGLKLNINAEIESDKIYNLLLDFDASRSIVQAGASGKFILKPVIRTVHLEETGAIAGTVEPADLQPWVYTLADGDTLAGTRADSDGSFLMIGIPTGTYQVSVEPSAEEFNSTVIPQIEVTAPDTSFLETIELEGSTE